MKVQNIAMVAGNLVAALCNDLALDMVEAVTGLSDAVAKFTQAVDAAAVAQSVSGLV